MNSMNPKVDAYMSGARKWREEMEHLRTILLDCGLTETLKWSKPCYVFGTSNVVVIQGFKEYCALLFFKGVLLQDPDDILVKTGENTRVGRQIRFTGVHEIVELEPVLKAYVRQAIEIEEAGLKVEPKKSADLVLPVELQDQMDEQPALKKAFYALTPGRQRAYIIYFSAPKQSATRVSRIEKSMQRMLNGKGLTDQ